MQERFTFYVTPDELQQLVSIDRVREIIIDKLDALPEQGIEWRPIDCEPIYVDLAQHRRTKLKQFCARLGIDPRLALRCFITEFLKGNHERWPVHATSPENHSRRTS